MNFERSFFSLHLPLAFASMLALLGLYGLASLLNLFIPKLPPEKTLQHDRAWHFLKAF